MPVVASPAASGKNLPTFGQTLTTTFSITMNQTTLPITATSGSCGSSAASPVQARIGRATERTQ